MPIYEFKCTACHEYIEILVMGADDKDVEIKCAKCGSEDLERILSSTHINMVPEGGRNSQVTAQTRSCSNGSCTTWNLPGHSR